MSKMYKMLIPLLLLATISTIGCTEQSSSEISKAETQTTSAEQEKAAILETINNETKAAFSRDYEGWQDKWLHEAFVTKTYINIPDSSFTETLGWQEIDNFVKEYFAAHPEPDPLPTLLDDIEVRLYGTGAWVTFEQNDGERGRKRETRLMEKVDGEWKIAGMHTTIYGDRE